MIKYTTILSTVMLSFCLSSSYLFASEVDLLVVYDDYSESRFSGTPETAITSWVDQINNFYKDSRVDITLRVVDIVNYNVQGESMGDVLDNARVNSWIKAKRDEVGADFVTVVHETGNCGVGYMAVNAAWAYNVVAANCGNASTLAHELGHNMGLNHSRLQGDTEGALYKYALGHGVNNYFGTLMTYEWLFNARSAPVFSNPNITCSGYPCGVPEGESEQADAAKALNNVRETISAFRPTRVAHDDDSSNDDGSSGGDTSTGPYVNLALTADVYTSESSSSSDMNTIKDGKTPSASYDNRNGYLKINTSSSSYQWVQYFWQDEVTINSSDIYWFDDSQTVTAPQNASLYYYNGSDWIEVGSMGTRENQFNTLALNGIKTTSLYLLILNQSGASGILEWRVNGNQ